MKVVAGTTWNCQNGIILCHVMVLMAIKSYLTTTTTMLLKLNAHRLGTCFSFQQPTTRHQRVLPVSWFTTISERSKGSVRRRHSIHTLLLILPSLIRGWLDCYFFFTELFTVKSRWTSQSQLDNLDFVDDLALLSCHTPNNRYKKRLTLWRNTERV